MKVVTAVLASVLSIAVATDAAAARKKTSGGPPTAEQRKKMYKDGLEWCRKKHGSRIHFVRIEKYYGKWSFVCYVY